MKRVENYEYNRRAIFLVLVLIIVFSVMVLLVNGGIDLSPKSLSKSNSLAGSLKGGNTLSKTDSAEAGTGGSVRSTAGSGSEPFVCDIRRYFPSESYPRYKSCLGDVDGNGVVNPGDRGFVAVNIGETENDLVCKFDLDGNGEINSGDRGVVSANLGVCASLPFHQDGSGLYTDPDTGIIGPDTRFGAGGPIDECGDGNVDSGEVCDGINLNGQSCSTVGGGFNGGNLGCGLNCQFDTSGCITGNTYFVSTTGFDTNSGTIESPFATLNRAFQVVGAGDIIYLRGGTYIGNSAGFSSLIPTASGAPGRYITVQNYNDEQVIIDRGAIGSSTTFLEFSRGNSYWKIKGLEIVNFGKGINLYVYGTNAPPNNFIFENIKIRNVGNYATTVGNQGNPFRIRNGANNIEIKNCEISYVAGPGIKILDDSHDIIIEDCDIHHLDDGRGVDGDADGITVDDSLIGEGSTTDLWPYNLMIKNVLVSYATEDGIDLKGDNIVCDRCVAHDVGANAFKLWSISDTRKAPQRGIAQTTLTLKNSLGYNAGESAIELMNEPNAFLFGNTFVNFDGGDETFIIPQVKPYNNWTGNVVAKDNIFLHVGSDTGTDSPVRAMLVDKYGWNLDLDYNVYATPNHPAHTILRRINGAAGTYYTVEQINNGAFYVAEGIEQSGVGGVPNFVSLNDYDFHLAPTDILARDSGISLSEYGISHDLDGETRPQGNGWDRGAYEN